jgi:hypothetical protein
VLLEAIRYKSMVKIRIKGNLLREADAAMKKAAISARKRCVQALKDNTPVDTGEARDGWYLDKDGNIVNEVEHIEALNDGHSKQAPEYFIEKTLLTQKGSRSSGTIVRSR